jgi:adenine deaminase
MTTLNPAAYLGLDDELGSIAPGRWADLLLIEDLENFSPHLVFSRGELVAVDGKLTNSITEPDWGEIGLNSRLPSLDLAANPETYQVLGSRNEAFPVVELISGAITRRQDRFLNEREGYLEREDDLLYCTLINSCSNQVTNGFVSGLGQFEALATTLSSSLNLFVVGQDFSAMARAASKVVEMGGGIALIEKGEISYSFPLKLAGVMSTQSFAEAAAKIQELDEKASALGYKYNDICFSLLFLTCDSLPVLRITASGIIDVKNKRTVVPSRKTKINPGECR